MPEGLSYQMFEQYYNRAREADEAGRMAEAKQLYFSASEALYKAAKEVSGETRLKLIARAEKLEALADAIQAPQTPAPAPKPAGSGKAASGAAVSGGRNGGQERASSNNGDESETIWTPSLNPNVHFEDIAGLEDVKDAVNTRIILPRKYPEVYAAYNRSLNGGILLYGPPGTGKTMIAKAIATEVGAAFFSIRCSDIVGKYFGEAEKNVKGLFEAARSHEAAIIFFDEFEALAARRGGNSTVMNRLVPELLSQIDGFTTAKENKTLLLAATNRPWDLDTAFLRPPRLTEKIYVGLPDAPARAYLIHKKLDKVPRATDFDFDEAVALTEGYNAADVTEFCESIKDGGIRRTLYENDGKVLSKICRQDILNAAERIRSSVQESDLVAIRKWEATQK